MYQLEIDQATSKSILLLNGPMTITNAQEIKDAFFSALSTTSHLCLDQTAVTEYDLSYMQLLISLYRTANESGKRISFIGNESRSFKSLIENCGCPEYSWLVNENSSVTPEEK